jgi:hypothetical protein
MAYLPTQGNNVKKEPSIRKPPPVLMQTYIVRFYEDDALKCVQQFAGFIEADEAALAWRSRGPSFTASRETEDQERKLR